MTMQSPWIICPNAPDPGDQQPTPLRYDSWGPLTCSQSRDLFSDTFSDWLLWKLQLFSLAWHLLVPLSPGSVLTAGSLVVKQSLNGMVTISHQNLKLPKHQQELLHPKEMYPWVRATLWLPWLSMYIIANVFMHTDETARKTGFTTKNSPQKFSLPSRKFTMCEQKCP